MIKEGSDAPGSTDEKHSGRVVYVLPEESTVRQVDHLDLGELLAIVWRGRWVVATVTTLFAILGVAYALIATKWYTADVLLAPAEEKSAQGLPGQFAGLASLAGITAGGDNSIEAIAVMKSRDFTRQFIEENDLLTVLLADKWDDEAQRWKAKDPEDWPDIRDAVRYFDEDVRTVAEDSLTGLVTLSIEWTDPDLASEWANSLAARLNDHMRGRALREAGENVEYLTDEMTSTTVVTLQQSIGRLLEAELQKLMLARGNKEYAFRIIDHAEPPKHVSKPRTIIVLILATILGGLVSLLYLLIRHSSQRRWGAAARA